jgi:hypothetical protein
MILMIGLPIGNCYRFKIPVALVDVMNKAHAFYGLVMILFPCVASAVSICTELPVLPIVGMRIDKTCLP